jgi:hypothetical protein
LDSDGQVSEIITSADVLIGLLAESHGPVLEFSRRTGLLEMIGEDHIFPTVDAAVRYLETSTHPQQENPKE